MKIRGSGRRWNAWRAASPYFVDGQIVSQRERRQSTLLLSATLALSLLFAVAGDLLAVSRLELVGLGILCFFGIGTGFIQFLGLAPLRAILASVLLSCSILALGGFVMARFQVWNPDLVIAIFSGLSVGSNGAALRRLKRVGG